MAVTSTSKQLVALNINGDAYELAIAPSHTLLEVLREDAGLTGTKHGCEQGECGLCTVLVDGRPQFSCLMLGIEAEGSEIRTVEGLARDGELHPLQRAWGEKGASQCGYCSPGMLMSAQALLERNPSPSRSEIREALAGNLCRCTGYLAIIDAVELAAARMRGEA
ncbi:MAG: (2Fe-2S)-binding protein [Solirubrobacterales bacterium]|nr:(2Fe-2S)-binding protein [Solirubrobacterales bacterium]